MSDDRVAEPVVLDDVLQDALEPGACPAAAEVERLAEHAELALEGVAVNADSLTSSDRYCLDAPDPWSRSAPRRRTPRLRW